MSFISNHFEHPSYSAHLLDFHPASETPAPPPPHSGSTAEGDNKFICCHDAGQAHSATPAAATANTAAATTPSGDKNPKVGGDATVAGDGQAATTDDYGVQLDNWSPSHLAEFSSTLSPNLAGFVKKRCVTGRRP